MPSRLFLAFVVISALLIFIVGIGSAFLSDKGVRTLQRSNVPTFQPSKVAVVPPTQEPAQSSVFDPTQTAVITAPTEGAINHAPTFVPTIQSTPIFTHTPLFRLPTPDSQLPTPAPERTGGPVTAPNDHKGVRWVTLQAGHYQNEDLPEELQHLTTHTGAVAGGVREVDINVAVARLTAQRLYERGYSVDLLDSTVPPNYTTDLFIALHADGNANPSIRGFKAVAPWWSVPASDVFVGFLYEEYGKATGLPSDAKTSVAMANYYAFNPIKYRHAVNPLVPSALLEMGFVSNPQDREAMTKQADRLAWGIANAVDRYFRSDAAGATPSPYPTFTPSNTPTSTTTSTVTPTPTPSATPEDWGTPSDLPPVIELMLTRTVLTGRYTRTPLPTSTPMTGTITADGRWLPPIAPNGRKLPPPGSDAAPVFLGESDDDPGPGYEITAPGWQPHFWRQYYMPRLGRSVWIIGPAFVRTPTATPSPTSSPMSSLQK